MKCPKCEVTDLTMADRTGVEIDYCCSAWRGVWLDRGELDKIIERVAMPIDDSERTAEPQPAPAVEVRQ
ncbi:MAG: zf-TFIIB domain-containing protein [Armatimonadetes bacterium]|nr:zf-TFIIB domain-containing protein [Armatimonadota bacterium]